MAKHNELKARRPRKRSNKGALIKGMSYINRQDARNAKQAKNITRRAHQEEQEEKRTAGNANRPMN